MSEDQSETGTSKTAASAPDAPVKKTSKAKMGCLIALGVFIALVVIGLIASPSKNTSSGSADAGTEADSSADANATEVSAKDLSAAYQENEAKAQLAYGDKPLKVTGVVKDITLDFGDDPVIQLKGANDVQNMGINDSGKMTDVNVSGLPKDDAAKIDKGVSMTFLCESVSEVMGGPQLSGCKVAAK